MSIWRFSDWIVAVPPEHRVTLGEGNTPLIRSRSIGPKLGLNSLYFKIESSNPTGSYKDRFAAVAISHTLAEGKQRCIATSSGNTGSALAAYCAAAQLNCRIVVVESAPGAKLKQMLAYGAELARVERFGLDSKVTDETMACLERQAQAPGMALQISAFRFSPAGMSGVQSISYELAEQLPNGIDHVFCPAGGGGLTLAVARGFSRLVAEGRLGRSPSIHCVQPQGNNTIAGPLSDGSTRAQAVACSTGISGLQVPNVIDGDEVIAACRACGGTGMLVQDAQVWSSQSRLAREEGIFCEPAAATSLVGVLEAADARLIGKDQFVVCLITGIGFKDPTSIDRMASISECERIAHIDLEQWLNGPRL
jgi:threonine synthase